MVGGFLDDVAMFDPLFFGITPRDAAAMDPQERLFLQIAWHTLEDAGYTRARLRERHGGRAGVFVGSMYNEYPFLGLAQAAYDPAGTWSAVGSAIAGIANRVSYFLDLHGPSLTVDTMCSSSLTAIHLAVASLRRGECEVALAGGVNLSLHPNKFVMLRELKMASSDHRCRSFGADGDGFVPGEGVGAVLLKPLSRAIADGDRIHAVILATAVNHDGKTNGYTVPNPVAQGGLVAQALRDAGVPPQSIGYLEAHGTGTALGDPVELDGLGRAFAGAGPAPGGCAIGSVKSNIGHLEAAAGIAGLTKVVLQLRYGRLVPSLHAERLNPNVDWSRSPFRVQRQGAPWTGPARRAGISSFGAGGANAHVIVESYDPPVAETEAVQGPQLVPLSARTPDQLRELAGRLGAALADGPPVPLADVAYTLRAGRETLKERLVLAADDVRQLVGLLRRYAAGEPVPAADGVDWPGPPPSGRRRIVGLPGYPFARMRCWVGESAPAAEVPLLVRGWRVEAAGPAVDRTEGVALCLCRPAQRGLAAAAAEALHPIPVRILVEGTDYADPDGAVRAVGELLDRYGPVTGVLDLCALPDPGVPSAPEHDDDLWGARLAILQQVLARRPEAGVRVLQVTSGLLDLPGPTADPTGARLAGFVRMLGAEYPSVRATVLDVDRIPEFPAGLAGAWRSAD